MNVNSVKGVILAAGAGSRLDGKIKALIRVKGKPVIQYAIERLMTAGIKDVCIVIKEHNLAAFRMSIRIPSGVRISYAYQIKQLGVSHALMSTEWFVNDQPFICILGDNLIRSSLVDITYNLLYKNCHAIVGTSKVKNPKDYGIVTTLNDYAIDIIEKPKNPSSNLAVMGIYGFYPSIFDAIRETKKSDRGEYEITDALNILINRNMSVYTIPVRAYDVGTPERLKYAEKWLNGGV